MDEGFLEKYPLVKRAFDDQTALFRLRGGPIPDVLTRVQTRGIEVIDATVDAPAAEKEALMTAVVLSTAPPEMFSAPKRFAAQYTPEVQAIIDDLLTTKPGDVMTTPLARITLSLNVAMMEDALSRVKAGALVPPVEETIARKKESDAQEPLLAGAQCPPLRAAYDAAKRGLYEALGLPAQKYYKIMHPVTWPPKPR